MWVFSVLWGFSVLLVFPAGRPKASLMEDEGARSRLKATHEATKW
jgi:hypothetical protein